MADFNPVGNIMQGFDSFNPDTWKTTSAKPIDAFRHVGAASGAALMGPWQQQLSQLPAAISNQEQARGQLNALNSPSGRQAQVGRFQGQSYRRAVDLGKKLAQRLMQQGLGDQSASTSLWAANQAANQTGEYAQQLESPEGLGAAAQYGLDLNDPSQVASLWKLLEAFNAQDFPRMQFHQQMSAADAANNGIGGLIGSGLGMLMGSGNPLSALTSLFSRGGGGINPDGASGLLGQGMVTRR